MPTSMPGDILIIGGGVIGVSTAYFLAERGCRVTVLDRAPVGRGCSYGNAGFVGPSHSIPLAAPGVPGKALRWMWNPESPFYLKPRLDRAFLSWLWCFVLACRKGPMRRAIPVLRDLGAASLRLYDELGALEGMSCGYTKRGLMVLYRDRRAFAAAVNEARLLGESGLASRRLGVEEIRALAPAVRPDVAGGVFFPDDAHLDPFQFVRALAARAEAKGVRFETDTEVIGLERAGRRISVVATTRGDLRPDQVILAAGAWSPALVRDLGLRLPVQPAKGYSLTSRPTETSPPFPLFLAETKVAVTPMSGRLRLSGTLELAGLDLSINQRRVRAIRRAAPRYLDGVETLEIEEIWRGLRPCTPDGLPIIGRWREAENLIVATGHAMIGMSLGPITGQIVAQLACGETPPVNIDSLGVERFA